MLMNFFEFECLGMKKMNDIVIFWIFFKKIDEEHECHVFSPINPFYFLFFYSVNTRVTFFHFLIKSIHMWHDTQD